jgi:hypothetical protein
MYRIIINKSHRHNDNQSAEKKVKDNAPTYRIKYMAGSEWCLPDGLWGPASLLSNG